MSGHGGVPELGAFRVAAILVGLAMMQRRRI
jgi:hypothetical protein